MSEEEVKVVVDPQPQEDMPTLEDVPASDEDVVEPEPEPEPEPVMDWDSLPDAYLHSHKIDEWDTYLILTFRGVNTLNGKL